MADLAELRKKALLTQADVAKKLNITQSAVSKWETGDSKYISKKYQKKLAKMYGVTVDDLLKGE